MSNSIINFVAFFVVAFLLTLVAVELPFALGVNVAIMVYVFFSGLLARNICWTKKPLLSLALTLTWPVAIPAYVVFFYLREGRLAIFNREVGVFLVAAGLIGILVIL